MAGATTFNFHPLQGVQPVSAHPELIMGGVSKGIDEITKGILAAKSQNIKSAKELAEQKRKEAADKAKLASDERRMNLQERHQNLLEKEWQDRLDGAVPQKTSSKASTDLISVPKPAGMSQAVESSDQPAPLPLESTAPVSEKYHRDFTAPLNSPEDALDTETPDVSLPDNINPLGSLTTPVGPVTMSNLSPAPTVPNLTQVPEKYLATSTGTTPPPSPLSGVAPLSATPAVLKQAKSFGVGSLPEQYAIEKQLYSLKPPTPAAVSEPAKDKELEKYYNVEGPFDRDTAMNLQKYFENTGRGRPVVKYDNPSRSYKLDWEFAERDRNTKERITNAKQVQTERLNEAALAGLGSMNTQFNSIHNQPLNDLNKSVGALPQFLEEYEGLMRHPTAKGINDLGLMDAYVRFAKGAAPNQMQLDEVKKELSLTDKMSTAWNNKFTGEFLSPEVRANMLDVILGTYNVRANMLNPKLRDQRKIIEANFPDAKLIDEQKPHEYPILRGKKVIEEELNLLAGKGQEAASLHNQSLQAGDKVEAGKYRKVFDEAQQEADKLRKELGKLSEKSGVPDYKVLFGNFGWTPGSVGKVQSTFTQPIGQ
jgi:hypothetical protein